VHSNSLCDHSFLQSAQACAKRVSSICQPPGGIKQCSSWLGRTFEIRSNRVKMRPVYLSSNNLEERLKRGAFEQKAIVGLFMVCIYLPRSNQRGQKWFGKAEILFLNHLTYKGKKFCLE
jgi:hypothetical protein